MQDGGQQVLIVTGSSTGIGAATARLASRYGYAVCVDYFGRSDEATKVVIAIERDGGRAIPVQADISSESDVLRLFQTTARQFGPLTGLVNLNSAVSAPKVRMSPIAARD